MCWSLGLTGCGVRGTFSMLDNFFDFVWSWTSFWLVITVIAMTVSLRRQPVRMRLFWDYHVLGFFTSLAFVLVSVSVRRWFDMPLYTLVPALSIFAWTAMTNSIRVVYLVWKGRKFESNAHDLIPKDSQSVVAGLEGRIQETRKSGIIYRH